MNTAETETPWSELEESWVEFLEIWEAWGDNN